MHVLAKKRNTVYTALFLGITLFESPCLDICVSTTGLPAIAYKEMLSESSDSKGIKRLLPLPAPAPRRRIALANIDPDIDGGDSPHSDIPEIAILDVSDLPAEPVAEPVAHIEIDHGDPDIDGGEDGGGAGAYPDFILGAKVS